MPHRKGVSLSVDAIIPHISSDLGAYLWTPALVTITLTLLSSALCGPLLGTLTEVFYLKTHKAFYDKCALQLTRFVSVMGFLAGVFVIVAGYLLLRRHMPVLLDPPFGMRLIFFVLVPGMGYGLFLVRRATWTGLNHLPTTRFFLGLLPTLLGLFLTARFLMPLEHIRAFLRNPQAAEAPKALLEALSPEAGFSALLFPRFSYALTTGLAATAVFGIWYLLLRRNRDDFGRDYYTFALKFCARWGAALTASASAAAWWVLLGLTDVTNGPDEVTQLSFACTAGASMVTCLLLLFMSISSVPMRNKFTAVLAGFAFLIALFGQLVLFHLTVTPFPAP